MSELSRRKLIVSGLAATAGVAGLGVAARLAQKYGLVPPDHGGIYGLGETLTYASQRLLTRHSLAREFPQSQISKRPLANEIPPLNDAFKRLQAGGFADWRLTVEGMVDRPGSFSVEQLKSYPSRSQITQLQCEEGWSYIAEWIGVPLSHVLDVVGIHPQAKYIVYLSIDPDWIFPIHLLRHSHTSRRNDGSQRSWWLTVNRPGWRLSASAIRTALARECARGFSQKTYLPASSAATASASCAAGGVVIATKSTSGSAINSFAS